MRTLLEKEAPTQITNGAAQHLKVHGAINRQG